MRSASAEGMSVCTTRPCASTVGSKLKSATAKSAARAPQYFRAKTKTSAHSTGARLLRKSGAVVAASFLSPLNLIMLRLMRPNGSQRGFIMDDSRPSRHPRRKAKVKRQKAKEEDESRVGCSLILLPFAF